MEKPREEILALREAFVSGASSYGALLSHSKEKAEKKYPLPKIPRVVVSRSGFRFRFANGCVEVAQHDTWRKLEFSDKILDLRFYRKESLIAAIEVMKEPYEPAE